MSAPTDTGSPFSVRTIAILLTIAIVSFGAVMVMAGWAPEMRDRNRAGLHPYSTSALGYNGLVRLLERQGYDVRISRLERDLEMRETGLMILTLPPYGRLDMLEEKQLQYPALIVLPKWSGTTDYLNPARQSDTRFIDASTLNDRIRDIYPDAEIIRTDIPDTLISPFGPLEIKPDVRLQLIRSDRLDFMMGTEEGALLAYDPETGLYILSDPDIFNTFGLSQYENARLATQIISYLSNYEGEPVYLDATLHGFTHSENLLKMLFSVPFLGATLIAAASALLLGWSATIRFGPPAREARAIALGKEALTDNSAGLVTMARRETRMAPGYASLTRRRLARALGLGRGLPEHQITDLLDRLGPVEENGPVFSELEAGMKKQSANREELVNKARALHAWRKETIRRTMHERG